MERLIELDNKFLHETRRELVDYYSFEKRGFLAIEGKWMDLINGGPFGLLRESVVVLARELIHETFTDRWEEL